MPLNAAIMRHGWEYETVKKITSKLTEAEYSLPHFYINIVF